MVLYALYMYRDFQRQPCPSPGPSPAPGLGQASSFRLTEFGEQHGLASEESGSACLRDYIPWFIFAFGGAGAFTLLTALAGLVGASRNNRYCLNLYTCLMVMMLVGQAAVAIALFSDESWRKKLPHDKTGEAARMERFIQHKIDTCKWVGLGVLVMQVVSVILAYALSSAQQRILEAAEDDSDDVWGRRTRLLSPQASASELGRLDPSTRQRTDPWSLRMREKYGLDVSHFTYDPSRAPEQSGSPDDGGHQGVRKGWCSIM